MADIREIGVDPSKMIQPLGLQRTEAGTVIQGVLPPSSVVDSLRIGQNGVLEKATVNLPAPIRKVGEIEIPGIRPDHIEGLAHFAALHGIPATLRTGDVALTLSRDPVVPTMPNELTILATEDLANLEPNESNLQETLVASEEGNEEMYVDGGSNSEWDNDQDDDPAPESVLPQFPSQDTVYVNPLMPLVNQKKATEVFPHLFGAD